MANSNYIKKRAGSGIRLIWRLDLVRDMLYLFMKALYLTNLIGGLQ